jgi:hypothetical protein
MRLKGGKTLSAEREHHLCSCDALYRLASRPLKALQEISFDKRHQCQLIRTVKSLLQGLPQATRVSEAPSKLAAPLKVVGQCMPPIPGFLHVHTQVETGHPIRPFLDRGSGGKGQPIEVEEGEVSSAAGALPMNSVRVEKSNPSG